MSWGQNLLSCPEEDNKLDKNEEYFVINWYSIFFIFCFYQLFSFLLLLTWHGTLNLKVCSIMLVNSTTVTDFTNLSPLELYFKLEFQVE